MGRGGRVWRSGESDLSDLVLEWSFELWFDYRLIESTDYDR